MELPPKDDAEHRPALRGPVWPNPTERSLTYFVPGTDAQEEEFSLASIASILWRRKWIIIGPAVLVFGLVALATYRMPKKYTSSASILIERGDPRGGSGLEMLDHLGRTDSPLQTEINLIRSRRVAEPVVDQLDLHVKVETDDGEIIQPSVAFTTFNADRNATAGSYDVERTREGGYAAFDHVTGRKVTESKPASAGHVATLTFAGMTLGIAPEDPGVGGVVQVAPFEGAVSGAQERIQAQAVVPDANLVTIICEAYNPLGAQRLCQSVSDSYLDLRVDLQRAEATVAADSLREQVQKVEERLAAAENEMGVYQERNLAVALDVRASAEVHQYSALESQREELEVERAALERMIRELNDSNGGSRTLASFPSFLTNRSEAVGSLIRSLVDLENKRSELAVTRTDRNPDIVAIDSRIEQIEAQLKDYATTYERALSTQIASLSGALGRSQGQLSQIPSKQVQSDRLQRQVDILAGVYSYLQTRLREAEVAKMVNLPSVRIVDQASLPLGPSSPNVRFNLAVGLVLGLGLGMMIGLYREYTDSRIRGRRDVERHTGIPVLGMIPSVRKPGPLIALAEANGKGILGGHSGGILPGASGRSRAPSIIASRSWKDEVALEAFRSLVSELSFMVEPSNGGRIRSVAVTSSSRGDGKTFTACNLAIVKATLGARTLLIDSDLRASGVARFFDLPWMTPGLTDVLENHVALESVLKGFETSEGSTLQVMSSGNLKARPVGLLERKADAVSSMIEYGEEKFEFVVIDTPPLNVIADAATVVANVDAVLVVARGGVTDRAALDLTLDRLRRINARVVGIVLNDVDLPEYYTSYSRDFTTEPENKSKR